MGYAFTAKAARRLVSIPAPCLRERPGCAGIDAQPDRTTRYCVPSTSQEAGMPTIPKFDKSTFRRHAYMLTFAVSS